MEAINSLISVSQASQLIFQEAKDFGHEKVKLSKALGRVLAEPLLADRDFPPYDRVTMDGYAINFQEGVFDYELQDIQYAGQAAKTLQDNANCIEIMTGAVLPNGCNTIIRYEDCQKTDNTVNIGQNVKEGQNIHNKGQDLKKGNLLLKENTLITPAIINMAASIGKKKVLVKKQPSLCIISTGDELVSLDKKPKKYQIRRSNDSVIASLINQKVTRKHWKDNFKKGDIKKELKEFDILIFSGGVSKGKKDIVAPMLKKAGVTTVFHGVEQRPGKPLYFGTHKDKCTVFALPGNPVSSIVSTLLYVLPYLRACYKLAPKNDYVILEEGIKFKPNLSYLATVRSHNHKGKLMASPVNGNGSGDFSHLLKANGFVLLDAKEGETYRKGMSAQFFSLDGGL